MLHLSTFHTCEVHNNLHMCSACLPAARISWWKWNLGQCSKLSLNTGALSSTCTKKPPSSLVLAQLTIQSFGSMENWSRFRNWNIRRGSTAEWKRERGESEEKNEKKEKKTPPKLFCYERFYIYIFRWIVSKYRDKKITLFTPRPEYWYTVLQIESWKCTRMCYIR